MVVTRAVLHARLTTVLNGDWLRWAGWWIVTSGICLRQMMEGALVCRSRGRLVCLVAIRDIRRVPRAEVDMDSSLTLSVLSSLLGGSLVAFTTHLSTRKRTAAEAGKLEAEAGRIRVETTKLLLEISTLRSATAPDIDPPPDPTLVRYGRISDVLVGHLEVSVHRIAAGPAAARVLGQ